MQEIVSEKSGPQSKRSLTGKWKEREETVSKEVDKCWEIEKGPRPEKKLEEAESLLVFNIHK